MANKLVILGDLLRITSDWCFHQTSNIGWFDGIFKKSLGTLFASVHTCCDPNIGFPFEQFYESLYPDRTLSPEAAWAAVFDTTLPKESLSLLEAWIDNRFALLFEGSPALVRALSDLGIFLLNIRVHPYRCGDDLFLTCYSNAPIIAERLKQASLHLGYFRNLSQNIARRYHGNRLALRSNSLIFLAQTDSDAVLIHKGRFFCLADACEELNKLAQGRTPYHKPHPHAVDGRLIREWLTLFPDSIALGPDLYRLFATNEPLTFVTASSGSAFEAETFGHTAHYLMPRHWGPKGGLSETNRVLPQHFWDPGFWDFVLNGKPFSAVIPDGGFLPDRLRNTIAYDWAPLSYRG